MPKQKLTIDRCEEILERAEIGYLGMSKDGQPYCLPFNFVYTEARIYIHTGLRGMKWEYIAENPRVCFTVALPGSKKTGESPCQYSYEFESVIVTGMAVEVNDSTETADSLNRLIDKYREAPVLQVPEDTLTKLRMIRIDIEKITGRQNL